MKPEHSRRRLAFFYDRKIGTKILVGYVVALALAAVVGGLAMVQLDQVNATVIRLTNELAQERALAEKTAVQIYRIRLYANQYILQGQNPTDLENYNRTISDAQALLDESNQVITETKRAVLQGQVQENFDHFAAAFAEIVQLLAARQEIVTDVLNPQGASSVEKLALLRNNSFESLDFTSALYASQTRDTFSQMQVGVISYLSTGNEQIAREVDGDFSTISSTFDLLKVSVRDETSRKLVAEILTAATAYHEGFENVRVGVARQQDLITNRLNVYGPGIDRAASDIADNINGEYTAQSKATGALVAQTRFGVLAAIGLVVVVGLAFGLTLSRAITRPIEQIARAAQGIANGALNQEVKVQSNDELGILAAAFNQMTAQVRDMIAALQASFESLQASEERHRIISEMISDYAFCNRIEPDGTMTCEWITESFERMTGYTPQELFELEAQHRFALFHSDDQTHLEHDMARLLAGEAIDAEYLMITKAGEKRWVHNQWCRL